MTTEEQDVKASLEDAVARGRRIDNFLADETIKAVFNGLELSYYSAWKGTVDPAAREKLHSMACAFDDLRESLTNIVESGERATHELAAMERETDQI